jgi:hypothetical protein
LLILKVVNALGQGVTDTAHQVQVQAKPHVDEIKHSGHAVLHPGTTVSCTNKTDRHEITEILLKVALNAITQVLTKGKQ